MHTKLVGRYAEMNEGIVEGMREIVCDNDNKCKE